MPTDLWRDFHGPNAGYLLDLYERYLHDLRSVDDATRELFSQWTPPLDGDATRHSPPVTPPPAVDKIVAATKLARYIRGYGHLAAQLDPLGTQPLGDPSVELPTYHLSEADLHALPSSIISGPIAQRTSTAQDAVRELRAIYSGTVGWDNDHIRAPDERDWLRHAAESRRFHPSNDPIDSVALLERLTQVEGFERFLHRAYPGKTRFSIEGLDMMVPVLDEVIGDAAEAGIRSILIGMAHRGRLNVLAHILNKPYAQMLAEFKDPTQKRNRGDDTGWSGDVKYHSGARHKGALIDLEITLAPNPSHLEAVNPVVVGMARAAGTRANRRGHAVFDAGITLPILIHGDAAFPGQGVVAETFTLYRVFGYRTGGTIHIIANNQLGYTANPPQSRSTTYASDLAKGFEIPVVHVNADDPEACLEIARLAFAYRQQFRKDFVIDLIGYRRHGHNEGDEPAFTQPLMYRIIEQHPTVRELWAKTLLQRGVVAHGQPEAMLQARLDELQHIQDNLKPEEAFIEPQPEAPPPGAAQRVQTAVSLERLLRINASLSHLPPGFTLHPKIERAFKKRRKIGSPDDPVVDWALAEELALATILEDGIPIRMTGEDVERGTFSQRHAIFNDYVTGKPYVPLQHLTESQAACEIRNSPLSEYAALGFEYGYSIQAPERLVIWEAQYGDFINGAQIIIDEFIASARAKWGQTPSLVLLLPHGYEGQGPDHSSARLERFLELCADINLRVANCTTAAQYFHLLRRQALLLKTDPLPLIIMTPKSLLRHPATASTLRDLAEGSFQFVIDDADAVPEKISRLVLCSGKVYTDLVASPLRASTPTVAIARVEQLYPFRPAKLEAVLSRYLQLTEVVWLQEEPENMGAWETVRPALERLLGERWPLRVLSRPRAASPAEGSSARHAATQKALMEQAYQL